MNVNSILVTLNGHPVPCISVVTLLLAIKVTECSPTTQNEGIEVTLTKNPMPKIHEQVKSPNDIVFGKNFSDHMLIASWTKEEGWMKPKIVPYGNLSLSPALSALHYSTEVSTVCTADSLLTA